MGEERLDLLDPKAPVYTADEIRRERGTASRTLGVSSAEAGPKKGGSHLSVMAGLVPAMAFRL